MDNLKELTKSKLKVKVYDTRMEMGKSAAEDVAASIRSLLEKQALTTREMTITITGLTDGRSNLSVLPY